MHDLETIKRLNVEAVRREAKGRRALFHRVRSILDRRGYDARPVVTGDMITAADCYDRGVRIGRIILDPDAIDVLWD